MAINFNNSSSYSDSDEDDITEITPFTMALIQGSGILRTVVANGVTLCLYDRLNNRAAMSHFHFPLFNNSIMVTNRFGNDSLMKLHNLITKSCSMTSIVAYIAGGAYCDECEMNSSLQNIRIAWNFLLIQNIPIISQQIGGCCLREVLFNLNNGSFITNDFKSDLIH